MNNDRLKCLGYKVIEYADFLICSKGNNIRIASNDKNIDIVDIFKGLLNTSNLNKASIIISGLNNYICAQIKYPGSGVFKYRRIYIDRNCDIIDTDYIIEVDNNREIWIDQSSHNIAIVNTNEKAGIKIEINKFQSNMLASFGHYKDMMKHLHSLRAIKFDDNKYLIRLTDSNLYINFDRKEVRIFGEHIAVSGDYIITGTSCIRYENKLNILSAKNIYDTRNGIISRVTSEYCSDIITTDIGISIGNEIIEEGNRVNKDYYLITGIGGF